MNKYFYKYLDTFLVNDLIEKALNILRTYNWDITLVAESEEELKRLLMRVKGESKKAGLKLNIQESKIMASVPSLHGD